MSNHVNILCYTKDMIVVLLIHIGLAMATVALSAIVFYTGIIRRSADRLAHALGLTFIATFLSGAGLVFLAPQTIGRACLSLGVFSCMSLAAYLTYRLRVAASTN